MNDQEAIKWLTKRRGTLMGYTMAEMIEVFTLAINALEERQAMRDGTKPPTLRNKEA